MTPRIGILEVGRPPEELADSYPSYAHMTADWLAPISSDVTIYPIMDGATPPAVGAADLWAITGSRCGVYEDHPWIPGLIQFVQDAKAQGRVKMLGICFGHQLIAKALGGLVTKSDKGWGVGLQQYDNRNWPQQLGSAPAELSICAFHQDQVIEAAPGSQVIARSDFCPAAGLWYPGFALSFQPHPEFTPEFERELIELRYGDGLLGDEVAQAALASMHKSCNRLDLRDVFVQHWAHI